MIKLIDIITIVGFTTFLAWYLFNNVLPNYL
jgi:hypothetical protein